MKKLYNIFRHLLMLLFLLGIQTIVINIYAVDTNKSVGQISYQTNVSPQGALSYIVPIPSVPNPRDLTPNVSLSYNSTMGNGAPGMGWSIGGISVINRVNFTKYYDGKVEPANFSDTCAFALDGVRLLKKKLNSDFLETEQGNILAKFIPSGRNSITFEVYYPNGNKAIYTNLSNRSSAGESYDVQTLFVITSMEDRLGNWIKYEYDCQKRMPIGKGSFPNITTITYGINDGTRGGVKVGSIEFSYKLINVGLVAYFYGEKIFQDLLLTEIQAKDSNGNIKNAFSLKHQYDTSKNIYYLEKIYETDSSGKSTFNPLIFNYDYDKKEDFQIVQKQLTNIDTSIDSTMLVWPTKFSTKDYTNGLVFMVSKPTYHFGHDWNGGFSMAGLSHYLSTDSAYIYKNIDSTAIKLPLMSFFGNLENDGVYRSNDFRGLLTIDYNGSGSNRLLKIGEFRRSRKEGYSRHSFTLFDNNGEKMDEYISKLPEEYFDIDKNGHFFYSKSRRYLVGDFLGNGYESVMYITHTNEPISGKYTQSKLALFDLKRKEAVITQDFPFLYPEDELVSIDFDGDGKNEILRIGLGGPLILYKFDENNKLQKVFLDFQITQFLDTSKGKAVNLFFFADINGDGKTDILKSPVDILGHPYSKYWTVYLSNGKDQFVESQINIDIPFSMDEQYNLVDIDGDGLPDLVVVDKEGTIKAYRNINGNFSTIPIILPTKINPKSKFMLSRVQDANKLYSIMGMDMAKKNITLIKNSLDLKHDRLMSSSTNSFGIETKYEYGNLLDKEVCSIDLSKELAFPYNSFVEDMYVLNKVETNYKNSAIESKIYKYDTPVLHRQGLGFKGFYKFSVTDNLRNQTVVQEFDPLNYGISTNVTSPISEQINKYRTILSDNKSVQILLEEAISKDKLNGTESTSLFRYDSYGNLTNKTTDYGSGIKITSSYEYINKDNPSDDLYQLGILKKQIETSTRNNQTISNKSEIEEFSSIYLPQNTKEYYDDNLVSESAYVYDDIFNLKESKKRVYDSPTWLTTKYDYDSYGRVIKETDPLGFTTENIYDGYLLKAVKNHKGHETVYTYDTWGRNTLTTYPDGTTKSVDFKWDTSVPDALYSVFTKETGSPDGITYFDALGREIRSGSKRFDGRFLYVDQKYDKRGRVEAVSLPFKGSSPSLWNANSYDNYDRPKSIAYASGKEDLFYYDKLKTISVVDGVMTLKEADATGKTIRVEDASGEIIYNLRADGQPESIVAPGGVETSFEYDKYGRQTAINDPSAGTKTFSYDNKGNIEEEADARGKTISYVYDDFNRLVTKDIKDEFTTSYTYNSDNLLEKISSTNGISKEFTYDEYFRPLKQKESIVDGKWLESALTYRPDGNVGSIEYRSQLGGLATEKYEYTNGIHTELKINDTESVWTLTAENDMGMPTQSETGIVKRTYEYDQYGLPQRRSLNVDNKYIQDFGYEFDAKTGNLKWRKDNTRDLTEHFSYDILNRLTDFGDTSIDYDKKGNITRHSQIGVFAYNNVKPYAIEKVAPYGKDIPMREQKITYNTQMRPESISENDYVVTFGYTTAGDRMKMHIKKKDKDFLTRYYLSGLYETDVDSIGKTTERLYLGGDAYTAAAVLIKEGTSSKLNYIGRDYLGSITHVIDATGVVIEELSYDAWGRFRDPKTQKIYSFDTEIYPVLGWRGYTGHEHLPMFGLINMNARLYDPVVGRFLSPDPYVQAPDFSQNFNRYSYALNNPLRYTDPNGEFAFIPLVIVAATAFTTSYVTHGITTGNWGMRAITSGLLSASASTIGYLTMGFSAGIGVFQHFSTAGAIQYSSLELANSLLSNIISPIEILSIGNYSYSLSPTAMLTAGIPSIARGSGFKLGLIGQNSLKIGDWTLSSGVDSDGRIFGGFSYDDGKQGFSYYHTAYTQGDKQRTGTIGLRKGDFSLKWENDLFGDRNDRFRSHAMEIGYRDLVIGSNVYTNQVKWFSDRPESPKKELEGSALGKHSTWEKGEVYSSPAYIGLKSKRGITRIGVNAPVVADYTQNAAHWLLGGNYFPRGKFETTPFFQKGSYTPYSMY